MKRQYKEFFKDICIALSGITLAFLLTGALLICIMLGSCTKRVYVPVENTTVRTDTVYSAKVRVDSVIFRDSIAVVQRGDTVFMTKYRDRYRVKERIDTVYQSVIDSVKVSVPYPVERKLTRWEQTKMDFGGFALGGVIAAVIVAVLAWIVKRKRKR